MDTSEKPEAVEAEVTESPVVEKSYDEQLAESFARNEAKVSATAESATVETEKTPETEQVAETTEETETVETEKPTEEVAPEPFTAEQLRDPKFFDRLGKGDWERLEKLNPSLYEMGKAIASARGKAYAELQQLKKADPPPQERSDSQTKLTEKKALLARIDSLDDEERVEALDEYVRQAVREALPEITGIDPDDAQAVSVLREAHSIAASALPEMSKLSDDDLDAAVEADPDLLDDLQLAATLPRAQKVALTAKVMKRAAEKVIAAKKAQANDAEAKRKAEEAKAGKTQAKVNANAKTRDHVVESSKGRAPNANESLQETMERNFRERGIPL
jgi:hypothetical protein